MDTEQITFNYNKEPIGFTVLSYDKGNNAILVRPYSPEFKKPEESYPAFNLSLSVLNQSNDLKQEIGKALYPTIQHIIAEERETSKEMEKEIAELLNKKTMLDTIPTHTTIDLGEKVAKAIKAHDVSDLDLDFIN